MKGNNSVFQGTPEQEAKLKEVIESRRSTPGCLMPVLQEAQAIYGYLPIEVQKMIAEGAFLETASVYSNYYGTPKAHVFEMLAAGNDVMFEIDTYGNKQIRAKYPECVSIFIMTPTFADLEHRLRSRNTETEDSINTRLGNARRELGEYRDFDYIVFNDDADSAALQVAAIIDAEKARMFRNEARVNELLLKK